MEAAPRRARERRRLPGGLFVGILALIGLIVAIGWVRDLFPSIHNPFRTVTVDRSGPAVLKAIHDLRELRSSSGHFEVIVDVEKDTKFVPSFLKGERTLFVAVGDVDGVVDLAAVDRDDVDVSADRRVATLTLPHARLGNAQVDVERSYVYDRDRGLVDRLGGVLGEGENDREVYVLAERKLRRAALNGSGILRRAEVNTERTLVALLRSLGFYRVDVRFDENV